MKRPRVRFSIGGLMVLVFLVGAVIGIWREIRARRTPSEAELRAFTNYQMAVLSREVSEAMLGVYEQQASTLDKIQRDSERAARLLGRAEPRYDMPILRWKGYVDPARTSAPPDNDLSKLFSGQAEAQARVRAELERLRADEAASRAAYERERAARLGWLGRWVKP